MISLAMISGPAKGGGRGSNSRIFISSLRMKYFPRLTRVVFLAPATSSQATKKEDRDGKVQVLVAVFVAFEICGIADFLSLRWNKSLWLRP